MTNIAFDETGVRVELGSGRQFHMSKHDTVMTISLLDPTTKYAISFDAQLDFGDLNEKIMFETMFKAFIQDVADASNGLPNFSSTESIQSVAAGAEAQGELARDSIEISGLSELPPGETTIIQT